MTIHPFILGYPTFAKWKYARSTDLMNSYFFSFFFSFFAFSFFRSRFFNPCIPFLHTSPYLPKNDTNSSCCTTVETLNLFPSDALTSNGKVSFVLRSERSSPLVFEGGSSGL